MFRILSEFRQKLELDKTWEDYRKPLQNKIEEVESQLRDNMENVRGIFPAITFLIRHPSYSSLSSLVGFSPF